jgi:4-hydroxy-tetrahydrodipicolinate synthase
MTLEAGVWGVLCTPFTGTGLDTASLTRLVEHYVAAGASGLTALGVFGEAARLDSRERRAVLTAVAGACGPLRIVAGLTALSTAPAVEEAAQAVAAAGERLAGVMVQVNTASPAALARHLRAVHEATGAGIVVQDYPVASGVRIGTADLAQAVRDCPAVVAVKSEAPPTVSAVAELSGQVAVPVFGGLGGVGLLDELAAGAAGAMTGFSYPEGLVAIVRAFRDGGFDRARAVAAGWLPLINFEAQAGIGLAIRKECLRHRGLLTDATVRPPAPTLPPSLHPLLRSHLTAAEAHLARSGVVEGEAGGEAE